MQETRATLTSVDLHLEPSGARIRAGLEAALREAVRSGRLAAGTPLPSSRALAADLGLARNTVVEAYGQLVAEGWLAARHGSGTWVAQRPDRPAPVPVPPPEPGPRGARYDLQPGSPDVSAFPRSAWLAAARRALASASAASLGYTDPRGLEPLRVALAGYLARARGVAVTPDRVVVCAGYAQALAVLGRVLSGGSLGRPHGAHSGGSPAPSRQAAPRSTAVRRLAIEGFGMPLYWQIATGTGLELSALPVDDRGAVTGGLSDQAAVALTPAHQFPLGVPLHPRRRREVIDWAADTGALVIEDDYDGEFRYDRQAVGALQALGPEQVAYAGTASKSLAPGLRLGWLVLPARLVDDVVAAKQAAGQLSSSIDQLTLAEFISSGGYDRCIRRARLSYRQRRDRLVSELARRVPAVHVGGIAAGLHALVMLPPDVREQDVVAEAARRGLALSGLSDYSSGIQPHDPAVLVGYAKPPGHAYSTALARLCATLTAVSDGQLGTVTNPRRSPEQGAPP
jgi:GntR family transcriptional regulator / MocR family aminotransferase